MGPPHTAPPKSPLLKILATISILFLPLVLAQDSFLPSPSCLPSSACPTPQTRIPLKRVLPLSLLILNLPHLLQPMEKHKIKMQHNLLQSQPLLQERRPYLLLLILLKWEMKELLTLMLMGHQPLHQLQEIIHHQIQLTATEGKEVKVWMKIAL